MKKALPGLTALLLFTAFPLQASEDQQRLGAADRHRKGSAAPIGVHLGSTGGILWQPIFQD